MAGTQRLQTDRLALREWRLADLEALHAILSDPIALRETAIEESPTLEASGERLAALINAERTHAFTRWAVVRPSDDVPIGWCGFDHLEQSEEIHLDVMIAPAQREKGLGTEIGRAVLEFGFRHWAFPRIHGLALPGNAAAERLLSRLGMVTAGMVTHRGRRHLLFTRER